MPVSATAELDEFPRSKGKNPGHEKERIAEPLTEPMPFNQVNQETSEKLFSFSLPLATSGAVIPHLPETPPIPSPLTFLPPPYCATYKQPLAWRLTANDLFSKPLSAKVLSQTFQASASETIRSLINEASKEGLKPIMSTLSGHLLIEVPSQEKPTWFVLAIGLLPDNKSEVRLKVLPYPLVSTSTLAGQFLFRAANTPKSDLVL